MTDGDVPWRLLGLGGAASLCCVGGSAVGGGAVGGTALAGGTIAGGPGAGTVQVLVTALTVALLGLAWKRFGPDPKRERT